MDFTIGRTLGSREFASSKVKSFIMNFANRRPGDRLQHSRSSVYFILDERGHYPIVGRQLGIVPANEVSTGSGSDRVTIQATVEFAGTITRSLSRQVGTLTQPLPKGEEKRAPGTDFIALLDRGRGLVDVALWYVVTIARAHL